MKFLELDQIQDRDENAEIYLSDHVQNLPQG